MAIWSQATGLSVSRSVVWPGHGYYIVCPFPLLTRSQLSTGGASAPPRDPSATVTLGYLHDPREGPDTAKAPSFVSAFMLTCLPLGCALVHRENQWKCQALAQCHAGVGNGDFFFSSGHAGEGVDDAVMVL